MSPEPGTSIVTPHTQMYCAECLREIPSDAPRWYAVEDHAKVYACCSELCAFGSEHADPVDETPVADGAKCRQPMMESKLRELANATPELTAAVFASCKTNIFLADPRRGRWARAAPRESNGRLRAGAYAGYLSERRLYAEQVECYWRARLAAAPIARLMTARGRAEECAALRVEAERTRYRVSTWGWPYTWCLWLDRSWARIEPDPSEPTEPMEAFERACAYRRLGATLPRSVQMYGRRILPIVAALLLSAGALTAVWRASVSLYVFVIACCAVGVLWYAPRRRSATTLARERIRQLVDELESEDTATRGLRELREQLRAFDAETELEKSAASGAAVSDQHGGSEPKTTIDLYRMLEEQAKSNERPS